MPAEDAPAIAPPVAAPVLVVPATATQATPSSAESIKRASPTKASSKMKRQPPADVAAATTPASAPDDHTGHGVHHAP